MILRLQPQHGPDKMTPLTTAEKLRLALSKDQIIYTVLRHISRSAKTRTLDLIIIDQNRIPVIITEICLMAAPGIGRRCGLGMKTEIGAAEVVVHLSAALDINLTQEWI